jgi:PIN domain nuclease of toxin-antitoxin system
MRFILDTHTLLWFFAGNTQLSDRVRELIENPEHTKLISMASVWEMAIKQSQNKLNLNQTAVDYVSEKVNFEDFELLPIQLSQLRLISTLPFHHRDPFDRLLIAQGIDENIPILSKDVAFDAYPVQRIWN